MDMLCSPQLHQPLLGHCKCAPGNRRTEQSRRYSCICPPHRQYKGPHQARCIPCHTCSLFCLPCLHQRLSWVDIAGTRALQSRWSKCLARNFGRRSASQTLHRSARLPRPCDRTCPQDSTCTRLTHGRRRICHLRIAGSLRSSTRPRARFHASRTNTVRTQCSRPSAETRPRCIDCSCFRSQRQ